jgi:alpha-beta hydrolase superfamily lysophospholipase
MMITETPWKLDTPDGFVIHGVTSSDGPAHKAIFMVHGLTGHMNEYHFKRAADVLAAKGYDVYRFDLYSGEKGGRRMENCTLDTHAADLNTVMQAFGTKYNKCFAIGHSYGGPSVMLANPDGLTAASLWDPSYDLAKVQEEFGDNYETGDTYDLLNWGTTYLIGKPMRKQARSLDAAACRKLAHDFNAPVQVVMAGNGYYVNKGESYDSFGDSRNRRDVVEGTVHCFNEGQTCEVLLEKTLNWFENF